ncbi:hypothetical protein GOPIP_067_00330 [Gordonia polyisoprenivorans NBRC 16320 = JCM 10675]|nr:hypothetical protein GOPIP_067_00330 [Gordonia polyisoprenivorans NBRC 16320 = JCM 10675]
MKDSTLSFEVYIRQHDCTATREQIIELRVFYKPINPANRRNATQQVDNFIAVLLENPTSYNQLTIKGFVGETAHRIHKHRQPLILAILTKKQDRTQITRTQLRKFP